MSTNKPTHTPGPWIIGNENNQCAEVCIGESETVASLDRFSSYTGNETMSRSEMLSNAHLIAAAPEMLKALEGLAEAFSFIDGCDCGGDAGCITCKAIAAIAKAKGETE